MMATNNDSGTNDTGLNLDNEDRLPWLEAADSYDDDEPVSPTRLLALVVAGLVLIGGVLGGLWWMQGGGSRGEGELIAAQDGPYKQPPVNDGAKQFEGEGDSSFAASEGAEPEGKLDPAKMPEKPVEAPPAPVKAAAPGRRSGQLSPSDLLQDGRRKPLSRSHSPSPLKPTALSLSEEASCLPGYT